MKRLIREQIARKALHVQNLTAATSALQAEIDAFNAALLEAGARVEKARGVLNQAIDNACLWCNEIQTLAQDYFDDRSEKWQESENGQAYEEWISDLAPYLIEVDMQLPEELEMPDEDPADMVEQIPEEVP